MKRFDDFLTKRFGGVLTKEEAYILFRFYIIAIICATFFTEFSILFPSMTFTDFIHQFANQDAIPRIFNPDFLEEAQKELNQLPEGTMGTIDIMVHNGLDSCSVHLNKNDLEVAENGDKIDPDNAKEICFKDFQKPNKGVEIYAESRFISPDNGITNDFKNVLPAARDANLCSTSEERTTSSSNGKPLGPNFQAGVAGTTTTAKTNLDAYECKGGESKGVTKCAAVLNIEKYTKTAPGQVPVKGIRVIRYDKDGNPIVFDTREIPDPERREQIEDFLTRNLKESMKACNAAEEWSPGEYFGGEVAFNLPIDDPAWSQENEIVDPEVGPNYNQLADMFRQALKEA